VNAALQLERGNGHWTYAKARARLPESNLPMEIWDGHLVMAPAPFPSHQFISFRMSQALGRWVERRRLGAVLYAPVDVVLTSTLVVQPDLLFLSKSRMHLVTDCVAGAPDLVVEIVSGDRRRRDYKDKKDNYEAYGVKEYWILDPDKAHIEVWSLNNEKFFDLLGRYTGRQQVPSLLLQGFSVRVDKILGTPVKR